MYKEKEAHILILNKVNASISYLGDRLGFPVYFVSSGIFYMVIP